VTAEHYTDPYMAVYRRVPPVGSGICEVCHRGVRVGVRRCYSCIVTIGQASRPVTEILPISLYEVPDQYWNVLRYYKDSRVSEVRERLGTVVAATLARFTSLHWSCIVGMTRGSPTLVTTVPSTRGRQGQHPLVQAVGRIALLQPLYRDLLVLGDVQLTRLNASDRGFASKYRLDGHRVLLIEDTFTSGTRTQSAASALHIAGATAVGVLAAGRVIEPEHCEDCRRVWDYARAVPFTFDACCRCTTAACAPTTQAN
jgi:predicted amidophosphoribosyltransferase